jgi:hypothetical protein
MRACGCTSGEEIKVGGKGRRLNLVEAAADPDVAAVSVSEARSILAEALHGLPEHRATVLAPIQGHQVRLAVEGLVDNAMSPRPHLPFRGAITGPNPPGSRTALSATPVDLPALELQPLTAVDDADFFKTLAAEANVPAPVRDGLVALHGAK